MPNNITLNNVTLVLRADTYANWISAKPILAAGEVALVTDRNIFIRGNGSDNAQTLLSSPFTYAVLHCTSKSGATKEGALYLDTTNKKLYLGGATPQEFSFTLTKATSTALGGIRVGYTTSGKNYAVQVDDNGNAFVTVPWTDSDTVYSAGEGITITDKVVGLATVHTAESTVGPSGNVTGSNNSTVTIPQITIDKYGRVKTLTGRTYTSKDTHYTVETAVAGDTVATGNAAVNAGVSPIYINLRENNTRSSGFSIGVGSSEYLHIRTDASGNINIEPNMEAFNGTYAPASVTTTIEQVRAIAQGKAQAYPIDATGSVGSNNLDKSYSKVIETLLDASTMSSQVYNVGDSLLLLTTEAPDFWVVAYNPNNTTGIQSNTSSTVTTLKNFANNATESMIYIGKYAITKLETRKIDLTPYQTSTLATPVTVDGTSRTTVNAALTALATLANSNKSSLSSLTTRVSNAESTINSHTTSISNLTTNYGALSSALEGTQGDVSSLTNRISTLESSVVYKTDTITLSGGGASR